MAKIDATELELLRRAVRIYITVAYPEGPPGKLAAALDDLTYWTAASPLNPILIRQEISDDHKYSLRLGCLHYPHMKMLVSRWEGGRQCFFSVDAHDKHVAVSLDHAEYQALGDLRQQNRSVVEAIETAWNAAGLPTFTSCLQDDLLARERITEGGECLHDILF